MTTATTDVVIIGAGMVGAACAFFCSAAGLSVTMIERGPIGGGTTASCEGNILLSDKEPGPELDLALLSSRLWSEVAQEVGADKFEYQRKGGVVVALTTDSATALRDLAAQQRAAGIESVDLDAASLRELEPNVSAAAVGGAFYPQDSQVQPMLATAQLVRYARDRGVRVVPGTSVTGVTRGRDGAVTGVRTDSPTLPQLSAKWVINAAGTWADRIAEMAGATIPVLPRRGFILVTEPLPRVVRHKVYTADYVANVASSDAGLETSVVVEGTQSGSVLIGASRERVGFDRTISLPVIRQLAAQAVEVFPFLARVNLLRTYLGFRPYCPDHLPVIGPDPRAPGLIQATGHEGAGIGLSMATGRLIAQVITGAEPEMSLDPFRPNRFPEAVEL
ncbi:Glycine/D-amino acid oxidase [Nakamurella panacisegetis]|uniref:Glycine/D-amino acid oxidase n=1 Tax=Nakamurella panacisegetis TaxID=1090615 RepID=A0A1H0S731_9ACTN|nr:FAD-dependent oxidoreductase [Nakamurella panacisegetis]SDP37455.1 Glycine/D-amino acid oxidase [Nakamurella panacisegetis]